MRLKWQPRVMLIALNSGLLLFAAASLARPQSVPAGAAKATPGVSPRDVFGVWMAPSPLAGLRADEVPAMKPEAQAQFEARGRERRENLTTTDPVYRCEPPGIPHAYQNGPSPFEIFQTTNRIMMFFESEHMFREIWMDGRPLPKDPDPSWMGYAVGHWDGNDLVIESNGYNDKTWLDPAGHPHSDALHVTERFHRASHDALELTVTIDDPKSYAEPWTMTDKFDLKAGWEIGEFFCSPSEQQDFDTNVMKPILKNKVEQK